MMSEWMKVMLDEIARKKAQAEQARAEERQRAAELPGRAAENAPPRPGTDRARMTKLK
jgi:hypothetical protein